MTKLIEFPFYATADGRQRLEMGLPIYEDHGEGSSVSSNVEFFNETDWKTSLKLRKTSLSGRLRQIKQRFDTLRGHNTRGRIYSLQRYRDNLRWKGRI
jgi:hypothetical protein